MESAGRKLGVRVATVKLRALRRKHARVRSSKRRAMYGRLLRLKVPTGLLADSDAVHGSGYYVRQANLGKAARYVSLWPVPIFMPGS